MKQEIATLGGGCFWCLDGGFRRIKGVINVESGYCGGSTLNPTYEHICTGQTGHAEVVQITYDPNIIDFNALLNAFFTLHDPTTLNRQGADRGTQYRSVIFFHTPAQQSEAEQKIAQLDQAGIWSDPIVTQIVALETFYPAESYHQDYFNNNPQAQYCQVVIEPKIKKLLKEQREIIEQ